VEALPRQAQEVFQCSTRRPKLIVIPIVIFFLVVVILIPIVVVIPVLIVEFFVFIDVFGVECTHPRSTHRTFESFQSTHLQRYAPPS
jgi:hypothetical protein